MSNCLYVKRFSNGKMYVGVTNNFDRRMRDHENLAYEKFSQFAVHRAMRKYSHTTEVWVDNVESREDLNRLEVCTISKLKEEGIVLYNMTIGGDGVVGLTVSEDTKQKIRGVNSSRAKPMSFYEESPTARGHFKVTCKRMGWDFEDFEEIFAKWYIRSNGKRQRRYFYKKRSSK